MSALAHSFVQNINLSWNSPVVYGLLSLVVTMFGPRLVNNVPEAFIQLYKNIFFRTAICLTIVYMSTKNLVVSVAIAIVFCVYASLTASQEVQEAFRLVRQGRFEQAMHDMQHQKRQDAADEQNDDALVDGYSLKDYHELGNNPDQGLEGKDTYLIDTDTQLRNQIDTSYICPGKRMENTTPLPFEDAVHTLFNLPQSNEDTVEAEYEENSIEQEDNTINIPVVGGMSVRKGLFGHTCQQ